MAELYVYDRRFGAVKLIARHSCSDELENAEILARFGIGAHLHVERWDSNRKFSVVQHGRMTP